MLSQPFDSLGEVNHRRGMRRGEIGGVETGEARREDLNELASAG